MQKRSLSILVLMTIGVAACTTPVNLDKDALVSQGLSLMSDEEIAEAYVGNTCRGTVFDTSGSVMSSFENVYRTDGTVTKTVTRAGGEPDSRERTWRMSGGEFCETLYSSGDEWCEASETMWSLGDDIYLFNEDGSVQIKYECS